MQDTDAKGMIPSLKDITVCLYGTVQNHEIYGPADSGLRATSFNYELG